MGRSRPVWAHAGRRPTRSSAVALLVAVLLGVLAGVAAGGNPVLALVALGCVPVGLRACTRPDLALGLLVFAIFTGASDVVARQTGVPLLLELLLALTVFAHVTTDRRVLAPLSTHTVLALAAVPFITFASILWATNQPAAIDDARTFLVSGIIAFVVALVARGDAAFRAAAWAIVLAGAFLGALGAFVVLTGQFDAAFGGFSSAPEHQLVGETDVNRLSGPIGEPNFFAQRLVLILPFTLYLAANSSRRLRYIAIATTVAVLFSVVFSFSRGGLLAAGAVGAGWVAARFDVRRMIAAGLAVGVVLVLLPPLPYTERIFQLTQVPSAATGANIIDPSLRGRVSEAIAGARMFADNPVTGVGAGNYPYQYLAYSPEIGLDGRREPRQAHSLYLEVIAELGVLGVAAWSFVVASALRASRVATGAGADRSRILSASRLAIVGYLIASAFLHHAFGHPFWAVVGLALVGGSHVAVRHPPPEAANPKQFEMNGARP